MADAFDPTAYLAKKTPKNGDTGFNPEAYLASKSALPPDGGTVAGSKYIPLGVRAPDPEPSFMERVGDRVKDAAHTIATGAETVGHVVRHPTELTDASKRRELERGIDDMVTAGYGQKLAGWAGRKLGDAPEVDLNATQQADAENAPGYRAGGNLVGGFLPGVASTLGKAGGAVAGKLLNVPAKGALAGAGMGAARGMLGYELGNVPLSGLQANAAGKPVLPAMTSAASDPVGLAVAAGGGAAAGAGRGAAAKLRDPHTIEGRTLQDVQAAGGEVRPFGAPVHGGLYEAPEMADLKQGRAGMNQLAEQSEQQLKDYNREVLSTARTQYGKSVDNVLAEHADKFHPVEATHAALDDAAAENKTSTGVVIDKAKAAKLDHLRSLLTVKTDQLDQRASQAAGEAVYVEAPAAKVADLIKVKKFVDDQADWKNVSTPENRPYRLIYKALNQDASAVDPRIAQMNQHYAQTMGQLEQANDILYGKAKADLPDSATKSKAAALKLGRIGDETQAGTTDRLQQLGQLDPNYKNVLQQLAAKKAMERLRYGEPEVSTGFEKGTARAAKHAVLPAIGAGLGLHLGGPLGAAAGAVGGNLGANPLALKLRLGIPAAEAAGQYNGSGPGIGVNRLVDLARQRKDQDLAATQRLLGAGP